LQEAGDLARISPPVMVREEVLSQQVRVILATGRIAAAQKVLKPEGFTFESGFQFPALPPGSTVTESAGLLYNSALRILLFRARTKNDLASLPGGIELAGLVLAGELRCCNIPVALETLLLRSQMHAALGDEQESLVDLVEALKLAGPEGFISVFVEEGPPIAQALAALLQDGVFAPTQAVYIKEILAAFPRVEPSGRGAQSTPASQTARDIPALDDFPMLLEPLTKRELQVLQLIAAGRSNNEIAQELFLSVSAVKKHTGNIYRKLGVNSRTQALLRARQLRLLPSGESGL
jgi:LuxR family maltose regulon positive regulatory protein